MTTTLPALTGTVDAIDSGLRTATTRHETAVNALFDDQRRQRYGKEIHDEKMGAANQQLFSELEELTQRADSTAAQLQNFADGADPLLALRGETLTRFASLYPALTAEAMRLPAAVLVPRVREVAAGDDQAAREVYRRALEARRAAVLAKGSNHRDGGVRVSDRDWNSELETLMEALTVNTDTGKAEKLMRRLIDTRISITKVRQAADGTAEKARRDFGAAIRNF